MSKKLFCLALALMMLVCSTAFAGGSKNTNTVTSTAPTSSAVEELPPAFVLEEMPEEGCGGVADGVLIEINDFIISHEGESVIGAFGEENAEAIKALLPEGVDPASLTVAEAFELYMANYDSVLGDVKVDFFTNTAAGTKVAVLSVYADGTYTWYPLAAEYDAVKGCVTVTFTQEVLEAIPAGAELALVFLNTEA